MENVFSIRLVDKKDAEGILGIYAPYVRDTIISFEYDVPTLDAFSKRVENISEEYPWVVCLLGDRIIGYAYAGLYRSRRAYQWGVESTIYMEESFHGRGIARILYNTLFSILKIQGMLNVYAVISLPNEKVPDFIKV
ncbi:N-acetyltransferase family protein [Candidatus Brachybacter algidus]|uniref:GNAT family N-acetyltransferase n=1 Tax=Candidatus Brachybacter algidus TaxID=2982024 RepID=UPI001DCF563E|nr:N-acetyltransferase family protein [Candidatus Brachybacter algidus]MBK6448636.1 N-acetyltransferase [Candidatus Brachybacter algidus]